MSADVELRAVGPRPDVVDLLDGVERRAGGGLEREGQTDAPRARHGEVLHDRAQAERLARHVLRTEAVAARAAVQAIGVVRREGVVAVDRGGGEVGGLRVLSRHGEKLGRRDVEAILPVRHQGGHAFGALKPAKLAEGVVQSAHGAAAGRVEGLRAMLIGDGIRPAEAQQRLPAQARGVARRGDVERARGLLVRHLSRAVLVAEMEHRVAELVRERGDARIAGRRGDILKAELLVDGASAHVPVAVREDDEDADVVEDVVVGRVLVNPLAVLVGEVGVLERLLPPRVVVVADEGGADAPLHDVVLAAVAGEDEGASVRQHGAVEERLARPPRPLRDRADGIDVEAVGERAVRLVGERARPHAPRVGDELLLVVLRVAIAADDDDDVVVVAPRLLDDVDGHVVRLALARVGIVGAEEHADRRHGFGRRDRQAREEKG